MNKPRAAFGSELDRSGEWSLFDLRMCSGLELLIERDLVEGAESPLPYPRRLIKFEFPASWAFVELSLMLQYFPIDDCPPVILEMPDIGETSFIRDFSINTEAHGSRWRRFRITTAHDVLEIISQAAPIVSVVDSIVTD
jgi:hypothetical protein